MINHTPSHSLLKTLAVVTGLLAGLPMGSYASPSFIAAGSFSNTTDLSGLSGSLENGNPANIFGGVGSGLAWAGGSTFIAVPDRGPNAVAWNSAVDDTTSYISRLQTVDLALTQTSPGHYSLSPTLTATTLLYNSTPLNYGPVSTTDVSAGKYYFNGRSDNFGSGSSLNPNNARLDPEAVRISNDGRYAYVSDEYGPYVYQFDRATGERTKTFTLPSNLGITHVSAQGNSEINGNTSGRVSNKGMEGLAISPDGSTLYGFMQSPLIQDGGDGGRVNRIVKIDIATGVTTEYAYDNRVGSKNYNSSEILAINDHEFLVLERDGKGLGDGSSTAFKQIYKVDLANATDVTNLSGETTLLADAPNKTLFLDVKLALNNAGYSNSQIPAKLEGMAWGEDVTEDGVLYHTLYLANDNDFLASAGGSNIYVFKVSDADLGGSVFENQQLVPEPSSFALIGIAAVGGLFLLRRRSVRA
jgi:Esterase-like activity of phytase/PEP-CTERM motif